ncbi:MAG TPA: universal stress protein [Coleofasciculaceae cyanobacterium]
MFKNILVGMDCHTPSQYPFQDVLALAKATGANLKLVHVFSFDEQCELWWLSPFKAEHPDYKFLDYLLDQWQKFLHEQRGILGQCQAEAAAAGISTVLDLEPYSGRPGAVLCEIARQGSADLIAVGHRDKPQEKVWEMGELRLGSVSEYVLHHAPCSVLIDHRSAEAQTPEQSIDIRHILAAVDTSELSPSVFEEALSLAKATGAELTVLHVQSSFEGDRPTDMLKMFHTDAQAMGINIHTVAHHVEFGETVGHNICKFAQKAGVDLILMGRRGLSGLTEMMLGSVSRHVSYQAPCAVLIVHPSVHLNRSKM